MNTKRAIQYWVIPPEANGEFVADYHQFALQALKRLSILNAATSLQDLRALPGNRFEALSGDRKGTFSIRINAQWRICFEWDEGAEHVEIVDYH